mmetsp:Transcript_70258/g.206065  ORF Transcript_70258/g.206065 Transcript_70258/m.206065 type:complete len:263 (+) Transcript_70258:1275-2063(+)
MISHRDSRFSGDLDSSLAMAGRPTSVMSCCVSCGSASRMRSPSLLKRKTADSKIGLDSEKSVSAGKKVEKTFQNSGGDFTRVSTRSCARFATVSKTRTATSSISRCFSGEAFPASGNPPLVQWSMNATTTSFCVPITLLSSSDSCRMFMTRGLMMSAAGLTNTPGCTNAASAPTDVFGWLTALRSAAFAGVMCLFDSTLSFLPLSCVMLPAMAFTPTSLMFTSSSGSSSSSSASFRGFMAFFLCSWMSSGASMAFRYRRSSW